MDLYDYYFTKYDKKLLLVNSMTKCGLLKEIQTKQIRLHRNMMVVYTFLGNEEINKNWLYSKINI